MLPKARSTKYRFFFFNLCLIQKRGRFILIGCVILPVRGLIWMESSAPSRCDRPLCRSDQSWQLNSRQRELHVHTIENDSLANFYTFGATPYQSRMSSLQTLSQRVMPLVQRTIFVSITARRSLLLCLYPAST